MRKKYIENSYIINTRLTTQSTNKKQIECVELTTSGLFTQWMKKALGETQTLRAGCSKVEAKIFAPPQTPSRGGAGRPKFNQLEMVTTFTYRPSLVKIDARNFKLSW